MRLVDADALLLGVIPVTNSKGQVTWSAVPATDVLKAPTIDAVPVVRCKDCKHNNESHALRQGGVWCDYWGTDPDNDDFCCKGERKSDA